MDRLFSGLQERIETLLAVVGITLFVVLALGAVIILLRQHRRR